MRGVHSVIIFKLIVFVKHLGVYVVQNHTSSFDKNQCFPFYNPFLSIHTFF